MRHSKKSFFGGFRALNFLRARQNLGEYFVTMFKTFVSDRFFIFCLACCDISFLIVFSSFNLKNLGIRGFYHISGLSFEWEIFLPQPTDALSFFYHLLSYHFSG